MIVEFIPEPLDKLQARYTDAMLITWVIAEQMKDRPQFHREHVFDCEDGIRLVISLNEYNKKENIHFTGAINKELFNGMTDETLLVKFMERFREISNLPDCEIGLIGLDNNRMPHFVIVKIN